MKKKPDFVIVGALKAGTTTLADELAKHPEIGIPKKELHFFNANIDQGQSWYEEQFSNCREPILGEATPTYGYHPHVPKLISRYYPDIKIIWILRDPVYRAYSNYWHVKKHFVEKRSFAAAIHEELACKESNIWRLYCDRSRYADQIFRYMAYFPSGQIHVLFMEEMISDFPRTYKMVLEFLDVRDLEFLPNQTVGQANQTLVPKGLWLQQYFKMMLPKNLPPSIRRLWPKVEMEKLNDKELILLMSDYFEEPNQQLEKLLSRPVQCWQTYKSGMIQAHP